jgi:hypothetical protein
MAEIQLAGIDFAQHAEQICEPNALLVDHALELAFELAVGEVIEAVGLVAHGFLRGDVHWHTTPRLFGPAARAYDGRGNQAGRAQGQMSSASAVGPRRDPQGGKSNVRRQMRWANRNRARRLSTKFDTKLH